MIYLIEWLIISIILPLIHIYIIIQMLNGLSQEDNFSQLAELLEKISVWSLKGLTALVIGIDIIQRMIAPALDHLRRSVLTKSVEAVPAVGDLLNGSTGIFLSTAVIIKNSIGVAGSIFCMAITLIPFIKILGMIILFKIASAVVQPISDKRITNCLIGVSKGGELLLRALYTVTLLFLITIIIVASTTQIS